MGVFTNLFRSLRRSSQPDHDASAGVPARSPDEEELQRIKAAVERGARRSFLRRVRRGGGA
jgi:hypothetical protein